MLEACTSGRAALLRDSIFDLAAQGMTEQELIDWMLARHGEQFRGVPLRSGAGLWAWILPPLGFLVGLGILFAWLRANRSPASTETTSVEEPTLSDADRERLAAAMNQWREAGEEEI
jgi:cytochrome c-type biogenesis protein CcmH/NrfF